MDASGPVQLVQIKAALDIDLQRDRAIREKGYIPMLHAQAGSLFPALST